MVAYFRPRKLAGALRICAERQVSVIAGGTDIYPARASRLAWGDPAHPDVLDITAIAGLDQIEESKQVFRIGCLVTWGDLLRTHLPPLFDAYRCAARTVGSVQVQSRGTLVGNLFTASPASAGIPNLLALDALVELASRIGRRHVPIAPFLDRDPLALCRPDELATALIVPKLQGARSAFRKLAVRRYLGIAIATVCAIVSTDVGGAITTARIAVGACSPTPLRLKALEGDLIGVPVPTAAARVERPYFYELEPIDDIRASAAYRLAAVETLTRDALADVAKQSMREAQ